MTSQRVGILIFLVIGLSLLGGAAALVVRNRNFEARSIATQAKVISVGKAQKPDGTFQYHGTATWSDRDGHAHPYEVYSESAGSYVEGQVLALRYDPGDPYDVRSDSPSYAGLVLGAIGLVFTGIAARAAVQELRAKKTPAP